MFLALADSGKLFACGVGYWGVLGPNGDPESTKFRTPFVSVSAPAGSGGWKRIGQADTQSFGWTETGDLYVWGRRFKSANVLDWEWVTDSMPRVVPKAPNGSPWVEVSGFGEAQPETLLQNAAGELWLTGDGLAITVGGKLQSLPVRMKRRFAWAIDTGVSFYGEAADPFSVTASLGYSRAPQMGWSATVSPFRAKPDAGPVASCADENGGSLGGFRRCWVLVMGSG